jgi:hypothetical protein
MADLRRDRHVRRGLVQIRRDNAVSVLIAGADLPDRTDFFDPGDQYAAGTAINRRRLNPDKSDE